MHNPKELIAYAKANAGKLSFSSSGVGNPQQLAGELMNMMAGTNVLHVPYRGAAPAVTDVATGAVTMSFASLAAALPLIKAGKLRAVAVTSKDRMPQLPDVAAAERRRAGPCRLRTAQLVRHVRDRRHAAPIVDRLNDIVNAALKDPAIADKLDPQGIVPRPMKAAEYKKFVASETRKIRQDHRAGQY